MARWKTAEEAVAEAAENNVRGAKGGGKRRRVLTPSFVLASLLFVALLVAIAVPGKATPKTSVPFFAAAFIMEALFLWRYLPACARKQSTCHIAIALWLLLIVWEVVSTDLKLTHPVLIPNPENVFSVFPARWPELAQNVASS